jgi:N utilization substance protein B
MTGRRAARRTALFLLYQWDVTGQPLTSLYEGEVDAYARDLAEEVSAHAEELDTRIGEASQDWSPERLGALERNILRIALTELKRDDIPLEVAIDEAVRLAKRYASADAGKLVNGILGRVVREEKSPPPTPNGVTTMSEPEPVARLQDLLARVEKARAELEATDDPERAVQVLTDLADLAKEVQAEIERARLEGSGGAVA